MLRWFNRLRESFGTKFLLLVAAVYWTQGFRSFAWLGVSYLMKDGLGLDPAATQVLQTTAFLPWSVKPVYGVLSDCVPIGNNRRIPYLLLASLLSLLSWMALALVPLLSSAAGPLSIVLLVGNTGSAMADVVVDAMVAEAARRERAQFAGDLQALSWSAMAVGGLIASLTGGSGIAAFGPRGMFLVFAAFPFAELITCLLVDERELGIVGEGKVKEGGLGKEKEKEKEMEPRGNGVSNGVSDGMCAGVTSSSKWEVNGEEPLGARVGLAGDSEGPVGGGVGVRKRKGLVGGERGEEGGGGELLELKEARKGGGGEGKGGKLEEMPGEGASLRTKLWWHVRQLWWAVRQPHIYRPLSWFVVANSVVPSLATSVFYFHTNALRLDAKFLGFSRVVGWGGLMLGTALVSRWGKRTPLRTMFRFVQVALGGVTLLQVVLITRANLALGISDRTFVLATAAIEDAIGQYRFMPFLVLSARLCPPGIEGTLFALFMSAHNMGSTISSYFGAALASALNITAENFDHLAMGVAIQAIATILPVAFLSWIPKGVKMEEEEEEEGVKVVRE